MHKTRNTGASNGIRGTLGTEGMLYSGECRQKLLGMSPKIPRNVPENSREYLKIIWGML